MQPNSLTKIPSIKSLLQLQLYQRSERTGGSSLMFIYKSTKDKLSSIKTKHYIDAEHALQLILQ